MRKRVLLLASVALIVPVVVGVGAHAQNTDANNTNTQVTTATSATTTSAPTDTPSATASTRPMAGYGYSDPKPTPQTHFHVRSGTRHRPTLPAHSGPVATLPGFEMLPEGGSRLFVELTQNVQVEERKARGTITYVLRGTHVTVHNNTNPLVTVHFNTPVAGAHLAQSGNDLLFVVSMRADATPSWKMNPGKEGSSVLTVDFPKGSYVTPQ